MYFLGVDAGGSKCSARLTDMAGKAIGHGLAGPANMNTGIANVFATVMEASNQAVMDAKLDDGAMAQIRAGIGVAGISRLGAKEKLQVQAFPFHTTTIDNDGFIANVGAHGGRDGGVVIVGTGSMALGRVKGKDIRMGGYGFPVSDEGSGAYIGLEALRLTLQASDARIDHSELTRALLKKHGNRIDAIVGWMDNAAAPDYAALVPLVMKATNKGDKHGGVIIAHAASHVELMIRSLYKAGVPRCALFGGVAPHIKPWLACDIQERLVEPKGDALDGALWLARQG